MKGRARGEGKDRPAFRSSDPIEAVQEATQAQGRAIICLRCGLGWDRWGTGGGRVPTDAAGKCGVQVLQE
jgi:hypothetical protein